MARYATEVRKRALQIMEAIMESLGLSRTYMSKELKGGLQVMAVNGYAAYRKRELKQNPDLSMGFPSHSDYSIITVVLQSCGGLEQFDAETGMWNPVREVPGSLLVQVGNYLEVMSNGRYKSALHRVVLRPRRKMRISIASLHSLAMEEKLKVAEELVDEEHPKRYREDSFRGFLYFLSSEDEQRKGRSYVDYLKIKKD